MKDSDEALQRRLSQSGPVRLLLWVLRMQVSLWLARNARGLVAAAVFLVSFGIVLGLLSALRSPVETVSTQPEAETTQGAPRNTPQGATVEHVQTAKKKPAKPKPKPRDSTRTKTSLVSSKNAVKKKPAKSKHVLPTIVVLCGC